LPENPRAPLGRKKAGRRASRCRDGGFIRNGHTSQKVISLDIRQKVRPPFSERSLHALNADVILDPARDRSDLVDKTNLTWEEPQGDSMRKDTAKGVKPWE
jgi:hypothetical protein